MTWVEVAHTPATHTLPVAQGRLHAPQCCALLSVLTSQPLTTFASQSAVPERQVTAQAPDAQRAMPLPVTRQALPQAPQLEVLVSEVSQPFVASPSQSPLPDRQVQAQRPAVHVAVAPALAAQAFPHTPQCATELRVSTHAPSHETSPPLHVAVQTPSRQTVPAVQTRPHIPQLLRSERRSKQRPLHTS
jgi:hypothetical protein